MKNLKRTIEQLEEFIEALESKEQPLASEIYEWLEKYENEIRDINEKNLEEVGVVIYNLWKDFKEEYTHTINAIDEGTWPYLDDIYEALLPLCEELLEWYKEGEK